MNNLRKIGLLLIITMSLSLTSGLSAKPNAQNKLNTALNKIGAVEIRAEILSRTETPVTDIAGEKRQNYTTFGVETSSKDEMGTHVLRQVTTPEERILIDTCKLDNWHRALAAYLKLCQHDLQSNGETNLTIACRIPKSKVTAQELGQRLLKELGGMKVLQTASEGNLYFSAASYVPGWGKEVQVGKESLNVQLLLRPDYTKGGTDLYIMSPVMIGDLGDM